MNSRRLILIALAVALAEIAALGWMITGRAVILRDGSEVTLEVQPVDPRDLLRGDYVSLSYNISTLPVALFGPSRTEAEAAERSVFVRLHPDEDGIWKPVAARYGGRPEGQGSPEDVDVRGTAEIGPGDEVQYVPVQYGIERFYLPEGEGKALQDTMRERPFRMKVAVASDGTPQIKAFYDGDTLIFAEPLY
jgi:uncharacterized membrane-anchored protein